LSQSIISVTQKNFKDANLRDVARDKAVAARQATDKTPEQPKYRDRASERRIMHNQPDVPLPDNVASTIGKKRRHIDGPPPPPSPPPVVNPGQDEANVGNKLLKMMGWKEGSGLGTDGEGRVDPMYVLLVFFWLGAAEARDFSQTSIYAQGVGLGASKGRELGKYTDGYAGYVHMAQDAVSVVTSSQHQYTTWCLGTHLNPLQARERFGS
jgi:hypothetical protein